MKINNEMRKVIWDAYEQVEFKLRNLKSIVQNEMELSDIDISVHKVETKDLVEIINGLHNDVVRNCK